VIRKNGAGSQEESDKAGLQISDRVINKETQGKFVRKGRGQVKVEEGKKEKDLA